MGKVARPSKKDGLDQYRSMAAKISGAAFRQKPPPKTPPIPVDDAPDVDLRADPPAELEVEQGRAAEPAPIAKKPTAATKPAKRDGRFKPETQKKTAAQTYGSDLRVRVTPDEKDKWNEYAFKVTGKPQQFSRLFRAVLVLLENAEEEVAAEVQSRGERGAARSDALAMAFDEHQLAVKMYRAIMKAGEPRLSVADEADDVKEAANA